MEDRLKSAKYTHDNVNLFLEGHGIPFLHYEVKMN